MIKYLLKEVVLKNIGNILKTIGGLYTALEVLRAITPDEFDPILYKLFKISIPISAGIIIGFNIFRKRFKYTIKNKDIDITLVIGNIFKEKGAKVIPTNTTFDTKMEDEFISEKSIQGQFQLKYYKNNLQGFNVLIENKLKDIKPEWILNRVNSKNKQYSIGTTFKINQGNERYYFLATANVNEYGKPNSNFENLKISFERLWSFILDQGHIEPVVIPVIGTGRTGINVSRQEVIKEIIFSFVAKTREKKIANELKICIHPKDLKNINLTELKEYLDYLCKFYYEKSEQNFYGQKVEEPTTVVATFE